jgi:hypothetical protein
LETGLLFSKLDDTKDHISWIHALSQFLIDYLLPYPFDL